MTTKKAPIQLPLGISLRDDARFENYVSGENGLACAQLEQAARGEGEQYIYLWGHQGVGCSHLLQSCCHAADPVRRTAVYLPLAELTHAGPELLDDLDQLQMVCIDNLEQVAGLPQWEEALFHLFNRMRAAGHVLVLAADRSPRSLGIKLPDLESRLNWGLVFQVKPLDDATKEVALKSRARARGLQLSDEVVRYLMHHGSRDMANLLVTLDRLDRESLSAQRRITVPFVKQVMDW
ncbi:DnaA regulatory inactivator Hda [Marinobacterium sp. D7]|uniref:DnaA regulatory inactivator Hda n=1 Tax=Marinobacterium ramblicola TaxID=2849041 RepID=UPI001C2DC0DE|nr:DnaA regulatory inactivator Hda [Marinobacterium ramblicola]MBV1787550.1 DnaA regulatory inactivator Hda [Marinobacterium ramblicola]